MKMIVAPEKLIKANYHHEKSMYIMINYKTE